MSKKAMPTALELKFDSLLLISGKKAVSKITAAISMSKLNSENL